VAGHRAFDSGVVDVVFDIVPTPDYLNTVDRREQRAESRSIARLLNPRSVGVVGASDQPSTVGRVLMQNLLSGGFAGPVYPVNPAHERVANMRCYPSLREVPDDVALAIVAVPPDQLEAVLDDAIAKHVRGLLIVTGDLPGGTDDETPLVRRLVTRARGNGIRIIGPASMACSRPVRTRRCGPCSRRRTSGPERSRSRCSPDRSGPASWRWPPGSASAWRASCRSATRPT
jgi:predicted CoA-binding protein